MLLREEGDAVLCIGQASHAWISGQLARAWAEPQPEAVCLAAEQHDVGWTDWDLAPTLDPGTGRPHDFLSLPYAERLELWRGAPQRLESQSLHATLLVSMHGSRLHDGDERATGYLREQRELQRRWAEDLRAANAEAVGEDDLARQRGLLAEWDRISLALCLRWELGALDPWPLAADELVVGCEGRLLEGRYDDARALHAALDASPLARLRFVLRRGRVPRLA